MLPLCGDLASGRFGVVVGFEGKGGEGERGKKALPLCFSQGAGALLLFCACLWERGVAVVRRVEGERGNFLSLMRREGVDESCAAALCSGAGGSRKKV